MNIADIWRDVGQRIGFFTKETRDLIPEAPGCYAWFMPLWIFTDDFQKMVQAVSKLLLFDPVKDGTRDTLVKFHWEAVSLRLGRLPHFIQSDTRQGDWSRVLADPTLRAAFQQALMEASILMPPLYVGKADDLRARYSQHVEGTTSEANHFHSRFTSFAKSVDIPLAVSDLLFVCVQTDRDIDRTLRDGNLNLLLEHLLMLLCRPPFSMR